jgi:hypothetical protein
MDSWNAATWAKVASHAALVAAHLKEIESVAVQGNPIHQKPLETGHIALEGLIGSAPSEILASLQSPTFMPGKVLGPFAIPQLKNGAMMTDQSNIAAPSSCAGKSIGAREPKYRQTPNTQVDKAGDRINRLREYDRTKKREQRDRHTELFRKVRRSYRGSDIRIACFTT